MNSKSTDVLVIGGGAIGLTTAIYLLRRGRSVTLIDRDRTGQGCSLANCGLIAPSHALPLAGRGMIAKTLRSMLRPDSPFHIAPRIDLDLIRWGFAFFNRCNDAAMMNALRAKTALLGLSRSEIENLIRAESIDCAWETEGMLLAYRTAHGIEEAQRLDPVFAEAGVRCVALSGHEASAKEPALRDDLAGARFFPDDAHLEPRRLVEELARVARARGAVVEEQCAATGIRSDAGSTVKVETTNGAIIAGAIVIATGSWSPQLARNLGIRLPVQPGRGYTLTWPQSRRRPRIPLILEERSVAVTPWDDGYRLGGTMEFAGWNKPPSRRRIDAIVRAAGDYLVEPVREGAPVEWSGYRPMTPDDLPFIGPVPEAPNVWIAAGHNMLGVTMCAATGLLVAQQVCGEPAAIDMTPFAVGRFG